MSEVFGLSRNPFAPHSDVSLYWENPEREEVRRRVLRALRSGTGVWLSGPAGSGKSALLARAAQDLAREGRAVLWLEPERGRGEIELLAQFAEVVAGAAPPGGLWEIAEALYRGLLDAFPQAGTALCFPGLEQPTVGALAEMAILARLRIAGTPLAAVALAGEGEPPFAGLEFVPLPPPSSSDLIDCLVHRAQTCGSPELFPAEALRNIALAATGFGDAVVRARQALARLAFRQAALAPPLSTPERSAPRATPEARASLFDPAEIDELSQLLESLSPGR